MKNRETNEQTISRRDALKLFGGASLAVASGLAAANPVSVFGQASNAAVSSQPNVQGAGFYKFKVGAAECFVVSDGSLAIPPLPALAVNAPKAEAEKVLRDNFLPTTPNTLHVNALVVKTGGKTVLIDTGSGENAGPGNGLLKANLQRAGIAPDQITDVVFTHAHLDHAGGNVAADGKINFPNARFHIAQAEWELWTAKNVSLGKTQVDAATGKAFIEVTQKNLLPLKDRIQLFKPGAEIVTGVTSVAAVGHTPGHTAYLISSGNESLIHAGDFAHHYVFQLFNPDWYVGFDYDPQQAVATRKKLLDRLAADRTLLVGSHLPFPGVGYIRARDARRTSYEWVPTVWQWQA
jgi:glyoxylase-like metal-dependent hydrolase (beta-lactamase superfamily II)